MGTNTTISWCDHTFNAWWGCAKVSPACNACYAEAWAKRTGFPNLWGVDADRRTFGDKHWNEPLKWDRDAAVAGKRMRVFTNSMADVSDNHPAVDAERWRLWDLIEMTPSLDWLLLTKRIGNAMGMFPKRWIDARDGLPSNIWLGATVVNQPEADRDIPKLLAVPAAVHFLSCEPLLEHIAVPPALHWVIVGGESGPGARPMHPEWARSLRDQCIGMGVAYHFKQWGEWAPIESTELPGEPAVVCSDGELLRGDRTLFGRHDDDHAEIIRRVGKKRSGRLLDGRTWDEVPDAPR
jgi:protein gp37